MNTLPWTHDVRAAILAAVGRFGWRVVRGGTQVSHAGAAEQEAAAAAAPPGHAR